MDEPREDDDTVWELPAVADIDGPSFDKMYAGYLRCVHALRVELRVYLYTHDCPPDVADNAVLIASEFAANAILHSRSDGQFFTARAEIHPEHVRVEIHDLGGAWVRGVDDRPHGLDIVAQLASLWGTEVRGSLRDCSGMRNTWARVPIPTTCA